MVPGEIFSMLLVCVMLCPLPGGVQGQVGWSSNQPGLVEDIAAHGRGVGTI